jgi:general nucleoside transport system permease protein
MADFLVLVLVGALSSATPLVLAGVGEVFLERAGGGFNLGIEGILLIGALVGVLGSAAAGPWWGVAAGMLAGMLFGLLYAAGTATGIDPALVGIVLTLLGTGLSTYTFQVVTAGGDTNASVGTLPTISLPGLRGLPVVGPLFTSTSVATYLAAALVVVAWWVLRGTRFGLRLRVSGDDPDVAHTRGISVPRYRLAAALIAGGSAGVAGAVMPLAAIGSFTPLMSGGRGFIVLAVVIIARRTPPGVVAGALLFAVFDSLGLVAQTRNLGLPVEAYQALPYLLTFVLLCLQAQRRAWRSRRVPGETE